jgi:hypothetical protein
MKVRLKKVSLSISKKEHLEYSKDLVELLMLITIKRIRKTSAMLAISRIQTNATCILQELTMKMENL